MRSRLSAVLKPIRELRVGETKDICCDVETGHIAQGIVILQVDETVLSVTGGIAVPSEAGTNGRTICSRVRADRVTDFLDGKTHTIMRANAKPGGKVQYIEISIPIIEGER